MGTTSAIPADQNLVVDSTRGKFAGSCDVKQSLDAGPTYWVQVREIGKAPWSPWHMPFK